MLTIQVFILVFTLKTLIEVGGIVLLVSVLATIFVSGYLLKVIEHDAKLETEIHYARERHNLHLRLQVERHDFYNHLTAIYGYIKGLSLRPGRNLYRKSVSYCQPYRKPPEN